MQSTVDARKLRSQRHVKPFCLCYTLKLISTTFEVRLKNKGVHFQDHQIQMFPDLIRDTQAKEDRDLVS